MPTAQLEINGKTASIEYPEGMSQEDVIARVKNYYADRSKRVDSVVNRLSSDLGIEMPSNDMPSTGANPSNRAGITPEMLASGKRPAMTSRPPEESANVNSGIAKLADYAKNGVDVGPVNIPSPLKSLSPLMTMMNPKRMMATLSGAASMVPGSDAISAFLGHNMKSAENALKGEAPAGLGDFVNRYESQKGKRRELEGNDKAASLLGKVIGGGAMFGAGTSSPSALMRILKSAGVGSLEGQQDVDLVKGGELNKDILSNKNLGKMALDAAIGGGATAAGEGLLYAAQKASPVMKKVAVKLMESAVKKPRNETYPLGEKMLEKGLWGTKSKLMNKADDMIAAYEGELQTALKNADSPIKRQVVADELDDLAKFYLKADHPDEALKVHEAMKEFWMGGKGAKIAKQLGLDPKKYLAGKKVMTASKANELKRDIYSIRKRNYQSSKDVEPVAAEIEMAKARGLRKAVEDAVPQAKDINKELQFASVLQDSLEGMPNRFNGIPLKSLMAMIPGGQAGGVKGMLGAAAGADLVGSTLGKTASAQAIKKLIDLFSKINPNAHYVAPAILGIKSR